MALVSINDAAKLVRKTPATLSRDIEKGYLTKTVLQDGDLRIDTAELLRAYGRLQQPEATPKQSPRAASDRAKLAMLVERNRSLERIIALEAELRRVKDQVTTELRARLADKDQLIKTLESKLMFLEYDKQLRAVPTLDLPDLPPPQAAAHSDAPTAASQPGWWSRLWKKGATGRP